MTETQTEAKDTSKYGLYIISIAGILFSIFMFFQETDSEIRSASIIVFGWSLTLLLYTLSYKVIKDKDKGDKTRYLLITILFPTSMLIGIVFSMEYPLIIVPFVIFGIILIISVKMYFKKYKI